MCGSLCVADVLAALLYGGELCVRCGIKAAQAVWLGGEIHMSGNATNQDLSNSRISLRMKKEEIGGFQHAAVT